MSLPENTRESSHLHAGPDGPHQRERALDERRDRQERMRLARERLREGQREPASLEAIPERFQPIWMRLREPKARGRGALSYGQIVRAAIDLADAEGPKAITMRKIAQQLGVGTMTLYWYVPSKDDLLDLMLDEVYGEDIAAWTVTSDWRADLTSVARSRRQVMLRHPWLLDYMGIGPPHGPNALRAAEQAMSALDGLDLDAATMIGIVMAVDTFVTGFALREQQEEQFLQHSPPYMQAMQEEPELTVTLIQHLFASGDYPRLERVVRSDIDPDDPDSHNERFEFGLDCMLDGIAARVERRLR